MRPKRQRLTWLSYRCFLAKGRELVPLFGEYGLANQLGSPDDARPRKFREKLEGWLGLVRSMWPACPARITAGGSHLMIDTAAAVLPVRELQLQAGCGSVATCR